MTLNARWHASLASPASLAGVVQTNGSASIAPAPASAGTIVTLSLANAAPGGLDPWITLLGQCGIATDYVVFGFERGVRGMGGRLRRPRHSGAIGSPQTLVSNGSFVAVHGSDADSMVVECGDMAPKPTR